MSTQNIHVSACYTNDENDDNMLRLMLPNRSCKQGSAKIILHFNHVNTPHTLCVKYIYIQVTSSTIGRLGGKSVRLHQSANPYTVVVVYSVHVEFTKIIVLIFLETYTLSVQCI